MSRFLTWVHSLPGQGWWVYLVIGLLMLGWGQTILWSTGQLPLGGMDPTLVVLLVYAPYSLAVLAVGRVVALRAVATFWPATGWPEAERPVWTARFAAAPASWEAIAIVVGAAGGLVALLAAPAVTSSTGDRQLVIAIAYAPTYVLGYGLGAVAILIGMRWLSLVSRIHREATAIDPFDPGPIFAFSRLTVATSLALLLAVYYSFTVNASSQTGNVPSLAFLAASSLLGAASFVLPLWGIHERLVDAKEALLVDVERRTSAVAAELYARIDAGDHAAAPGLKDALTGLAILRERVAHLPTWPWPPQVFRGFVSALLLPIVIFILTRLISVLLEA